MFSLCGKNFVLAKVGLVRAGCPQELIDTTPNRNPEAAIVIISNKAKLGFIEATGYYPKGVIVAGAVRRRQLQDAGVVCSWAYIEAGLEIKADDAIGCSELMAKLNQLIVEKFYGQNTPIANQPWPYINEVYPFENYFIFTMKGEKYRQGYVLDPIARRCALHGGATHVEEKFVDASTESMSRVQTGVRYAWAPAKGNSQTSTTGAKNSELVTQIIRNWADVNEAANMYLNYIRLSGAALKPPMKPSFAPVSLTPAGKIVAALAAKGIDAYDFARWSATAQHKKTKTVGTGEEVPHSKFAYVGDKNDSSTWHLPVPNASHARNALARVNQTKGIPSSAKASVIAKLRRLAKSKGVDVSDKATSGQKRWVKGSLAPSLAL